MTTEHKLQIVDPAAEFPENFGLLKERSDELLEKVFNAASEDTPDKPDTRTTSWMITHCSEFADTELELAFIMYAIGITKAVIDQHEEV